MWHWFFELSTLNWAIERVEGSSGLQWAGCSTAKARECETHPHLKFGLNVLNLWSCSDSSDPPLSSFIIFHQQVVIAAMSPFSCRWLMGSSLAPPHLQIVVASGSSCTKKGTHWSPSSTPQNPGCKAGRKARRTKPDKNIAGKWMENGSSTVPIFEILSTMSLSKKICFVQKNWHCACYHGLVWKQGTPNVHGLKLTLSHENSHKLTTVGCKSSISDTPICYPCLQTKVRPMTLSYRQSVQPMRRPERCGTDTGASRSCRAMAMKRQSKPTTCQCEAIVGICWNMLKYVGICWNHMQDIAVNCKCIEFDRWRLDIGGPTNYCNCM